MLKTLLRPPAFLVGLLLFAGCAASTSSSSPAPGDHVSGHITVLAAASLKQTFTPLGSQFEAGHPGAQVTFVFAGSQTLAAQINEGAEADVFASAAVRNMDHVVAAGNATNPTTFARNRLTIITPASNPAGITSIVDLTKPGLKLVVCQQDVPCGALTRKVFGKAAISPTPVSLENSVTGVVTKVTSGEADAGLVYSTDAASAGDKVTTIAIPDDVNATTDYQIVALSNSEQPATAQAFVDHVLGAGGQQLLGAAGFAKP